MAAQISFLGELSSTRPHPQSLISPKPFSNEAGEQKDALIHIAVAQVLPDESGLHADEEQGKKDDVGLAGLEKLEKWAKAASEKGADVVVFPEYFLSGATHELWRRVREAQRQEAGKASRGGATTDEWGNVGEPGTGEKRVKKSDKEEEEERKEMKRLGLK